jgi:D-alanyl-D-alanine carboxypeptidase (penicillin-binding protein 5/6)
LLVRSLVVRSLVVLAAVPVVSAGLASAARAAEQPRVSAEGAVLWDPADGKVLAGKAARQPRAMASTTKIMTVLVALEADTLGETVTVSERAVAIGDRPGAAKLGLRVGQELPMRSLLAGLMLRSGNDAAVAVAEHVAGSVERFVARMNTRADELGLSRTNFVDVSGLTDDPDHAASPLELARLARVAMARPVFAGWAGAARLDVDGFGELANRNKLLANYRGAGGVKTGYTSLAGLCLVASATRAGRTLYAVVLDSDVAGGAPGRREHFADASALLDHGFDDFRRPRVLRAGQQAATYRWPGAAVGLVATQELATTFARGETAEWRIRRAPAASRPVSAGTRLGTAELLVDGAVTDTTPLEAATQVETPPPAPAARALGAALQQATRSFARLFTDERPVNETGDPGPARDPEAVPSAGNPGT